MKRLRAWLVRLAGLLPNSRRERDLIDEIEGNVQLHIDENLRSGMSYLEARRNAILKLGGIEPTKEAYRDRSTIPFLENLLQDTRFSIRQLRKNPGFTATAVLMLALGLCANVTIFAFVDAALIKPLPYRDPTRLIGVYESIQLCPECPLSYFDYLDWKKLNHVFSSFDVYTGTGYLLNNPAGTEPVHGARVSGGFFRTLGVVPILGRDFYSGEDQPRAPNTAIITYTSWQKWFGGRRDVIGQTVRLSGVPHTIVGVLPRDFHFAPRGDAEFWAPLHPNASCENRRGCHNLLGVARLKDGVSVQTSLAAVKLIAQQLEKQYPDSNRGQGANVLPLSEVIAGKIRPILLMLLGGAGLLLLIACVNVVSLLLVRSENRRREIAVRRALGASTARLMRQFVAESLALVAIGSGLGVAAAYWAMQLLIKLIPADMMTGMPYLLGLGLNIRVLALFASISLASALLFSITPAFSSPLSDMREGMAEGSRGSAGNTWRRVGSKLVVLELATAMVLLVGAALLGESFYHLLHVDLGFQPDHLATIDIAAPEKAYATDEKAAALGRRVVTRAASLPRVNSVGIANIPPVSFNGNTDWIRFVGWPYHGEHNEVNTREVSSNYFRTVRAKLLRGRYFAESDDASKPSVVIISQALAKKSFPGEDPIGRRIGDTELSPKSIRQIVGIVDDIREGPLDSDTWPSEYLPFNQGPDNYFTLLVRTSQAERSVLPMLSAAIHQIDPSLGTLNESTMRERISESPTAYVHRSSAWLVGAFAGLALLLGVVGLYGVTAYSVSRRTHEIGVRMALGAERSTVYRLILKEAGWLTAAGIVAGVVCSLTTASLLAKLLFGVSSSDTATLGAVAAILAASALLASYFPARRAASVNPVDALRIE
ncbi:MAG: ABC transporter permease [Acidobacteriaceae bacterium]|nr:ABC transporter permease [Acidobacteriaceae bacterium]